MGIDSLIGPAKIPLAAVDIEAVLTHAGLSVQHESDMWVVRGNTYPIRQLLEYLGGKYYSHEKYYHFYGDSPLEKIVLSLVDVNDLTRADPAKLDPANAAARYRAKQARIEFDATPDVRLEDHEYAGKVSPETVALLKKGEAFGIPENVVAEQIADVGKIVAAFEREDPLFLLASEAGSGKTFVLGGAAREILQRYPDTRFCYVTLRQGLINRSSATLEPLTFSIPSISTLTILLANPPPR
jgi:hypothetical protein